MATAKKHEEVVKTVTGVDLRLTEEEAAVLTFVLRRVGGYPVGARVKISSIAEALRGVGFDASVDERFEASGYITLEDGE